MKFARIVYALAGIWSLLVLTPLSFLCQTIGSASPPPITHPEYYFGFLCVALAWAAVFFIIAADPEGMRKMMIAAVIEKIGYGLSHSGCFSKERHKQDNWVLRPSIFLLGCLFIAAFVFASRRAVSA